MIIILSHIKAVPINAIITIQPLHSEKRCIQDISIETH